MRSFGNLAATIVLLAVSLAHAQSPYDNPNSAAAQEMTKAGWTMNAGVASHEASTTTCPSAIPGFEMMVFTGPTGPNVVGTCTYKDGANGGDTGLQVRRYMRDVGESRDAVMNDRALMEPRAGQTPPIMMVRFTPITTRDGKQGGRVVITKARGGFLVDCFGEGEDLEKASAKIGLICSG